MNLDNWELVCWNYDGTGENISLDLSEEQIFAVLEVLNLKIKDLPNGEIEIYINSDEFLKKKRLKNNKNV